MGKRTWLFLIVIALFVLSTVLIGCGGTSTEVEPIKVGVPEKITGPYASDARVSMEAITMAIDKINADRKSVV